MADPQRIKPKDLVVGGRYLHRNGLFIRVIEAIEGDTVAYRDQYGYGHCGKRAFLKICPSLATPEETAQAEQQLMSIARATSENDFTDCDEANSLTAYAFRNGFLEDLHAGEPSPILNQLGHSWISYEDIRRLMIESSEKLEEMLRMRREEPAAYMGRPPFGIPSGFIIQSVIGLL
jgi:hypothetical protein